MHNLPPPRPVQTTLAQEQHIPGTDTGKDAGTDRIPSPKPLAPNLLRLPVWPKAGTAAAETSPTCPCLRVARVSPQRLSPAVWHQALPGARGAGDTRAGCRRPRPPQVSETCLSSEVAPSLSPGWGRGVSSLPSSRASWTMEIRPEVRLDSPTAPLLPARTPRTPRKKVCKWSLPASSQRPIPAGSLLGNSPATPSIHGQGSLDDGGRRGATEHSVAWECLDTPLGQELEED